MIGYANTLIPNTTTNAGSINIDNCSASGNVKGKLRVGGFIGRAEANVTITNSSASGNVYGTTNGSGQWDRDANAGGFIGLSYGTISNCIATGDVSAEGRQLGGFVGSVGQSSYIKNSTATGDVNANVNGNMVPLTGSDTNMNAGGFASNVSGTVENCDAFGELTCDGSSTTSMTHINSFAVGNFSTTDNVGEIINCYGGDKSKDFTSVGPHNPNDSGLRPMKNPPTEATTPNNNVIQVTPPSISQTTTIDNEGAKDAAALYDEMKSKGYILEGEDENPAMGHEDDYNWFTNMVNQGFLFLFKHDKETGEYYQINVATDTNLQEVSDETNLKKAEAKYEADMRKINLKDKKFDTDLASLETERNAIKTEMDTLKTVIKDNVDMTFKLFS